MTEGIEVTDIPGSDNNGNGTGYSGVPPSRKIKAAMITSAYVLGAMILATLLKTPPDLANNALWILGLVGGVTVGGQAWVDKVANMKK